MPTLNYDQLTNQPAGEAPKPTTQQTAPVPAQPATPAAPSAPSATPAPPAAPTVPTDLFKPTSYTPSAGQPDPRDATYWENINKLMFSAQTEYAQHLQAQQYSDIKWAATQQTELTNRQRAERALAEQMMGKGLSYSGYSNRSQAERQTDWLAHMGELTRSKQAEDAARQAAEMAIIQGWSIDEAAALAEAVARQAAAQEKEAQTGLPEMTTGAPTTGEGAGAGAKAKAKAKAPARKPKLAGRIGPITPPKKRKLKGGLR